MDKLTDAELCEIFKRLPPYERLLVSEVCRHWHEISRTPWRDVTALDFSPIPGAYVRRIFGQCPNLQSVFALRKSFGVDELAGLHHSAHLSCVKLFHCSFAVRANQPTVFLNGFAGVFSENLQNARWNELVLHDEGVQEQTTVMCGNSLKTVVCGSGLSYGRFGAEQLSDSLTRLQLSGSRKHLIPYGLQRLNNLECLILHSSLSAGSGSMIHYCFPKSYQGTSPLQKLRELCIGPLASFRLPVDMALDISSFPQLEVLFIIGIYGTSIGQLADLVIKRSALRILVLSGECHDLAPVDIPARKRYPNGFNSDPLPLLHVFVSSGVLQKIHFAPSDAALFYPINAPMPEFLEREYIAPIFKGVWIAEKIKESAKYGAKLWD